MMRNLMFCVCLILLSGIVNGCKSQDVKSIWIDTPMTVDGIGSDWENVTVTDFEDPNVFIGLSNTNDRLYVLMGFQDLGLARSIQRNGITIWLDNNGDKEKEIGIKYVPEFAGEDNRKNGQTDRLSPEQQSVFEERVQNRMTGISIVNRLGEGYSPETGEFTPIGASKSEYGRFTFEIMIPLRRDRSIPFAIDISEGDNISLGLEIGNSQASLGRRSGQRPMGGGGRSGDRGGGGMRGGMPGGGTRGSNGNQQMLQHHELWIKVQLDQN